jgi:Fic family protein
MDSYIKKLNFDLETNQRILQLIGSIDTFKGKWNLVEKKENRYLKELRRIATIESIGSSTRIEGATLSNQEVKELLDNLKISELKSRDEQEVIGYYELLEHIIQNYQETELTEDSIKKMHEILLKRSKKDKAHRGKYKENSNKVVAIYPDGKQKTIFDPTPPHLVAAEMSSLMKWINESLEKKRIHPLIVVGLLVYEVLSIHPFQDGNGRLSRLLTTLMLLKEDYQFIAYVSFEHIVENKKKQYYNCLMNAQKYRHQDKEIINHWMLFFLTNLRDLTQRLEKKYDVYKSKGGYMNERQKKIKSFVDKNEPVKLNDVSKKFKGISINTIKKDLQYLKQEQQIDSIGKYKGTIYIATDS